MWGLDAYTRFNIRLILEDSPSFQALCGNFNGGLTCEPCAGQGEEKEKEKEKPAIPHAFTKEDATVTNFIEHTLLPSINSQVRVRECSCVRPSLSPLFYYLSCELHTLNKP